MTMFSQGNCPEDATKLFNKALEKLKSHDLSDAERYFGLSLYYEARAVTYLEMAKLCLLRNYPGRTALENVEEGLKLCKDTDQDSKVRLELLSLKENVIVPLISAEERTQAEKDERAATVRAFASKGQLKEAAEVVGLSNFANELQTSMLPSVRIKLQEKHDGSVKSKFGGIPDVPTDFIWPLVDCEAVAPLEFLCQLDLSEIYNVYKNSGLPASGMLSFFADASQFDFGGDPSAWKVFYFENVSVLGPAQAPSLDPIWDEFPQVTFTECSLEFEYLNTLPDIYSKAMDLIIMCDDENEKYEELRIGWQGDDLSAPAHQMFGHPQALQQDVFLDCEEQLKRFDVKYRKQFSEPSQDQHDELNEWILLLQVGSDDLSKMYWGDSGKLYFCIRRGDLASRNLLQLF